MTPEILYQSNHLIIIDKPAGLPVHPGPSTTASVEDFFPLWRRGHDGPWLAHRLDAGTAGCLVIARRKSTLIMLQQAFAEGRVRKTYWAIVRGITADHAGCITLPLVKTSTQGGGWRMSAGCTGQSARTHWRRLGAIRDRAWLELAPETGRTHQLRAHCAAIGHPILGDDVYGNGTPPLHLFARRIELPLEPPVSAAAPVPPHMRAALDELGYGTGLVPER